MGPDSLTEEEEEEERDCTSCLFNEVLSAKDSESGVIVIRTTWFAVWVYCGMYHYHRPKSKMINAVNQH